MRCQRHISIGGWLSSGACAAAGVLLLNGYCRLGSAFAGSAWTLALAAALVLAGVLCFRPMCGRARRVSLLTGFCFALTQVYALRLNHVGSLAESGWEALMWVLCALAFTPAAGGLLGALFAALLRARQRPCGEARFSRGQVLLGGAAILLLCWLPYLAAFYPGLFTYDISYQYLQYTTGEFNTHHPLLHTLLMGGLCDLARAVFGYPSKGILLYTLIQMLVMALAMANALAVLYQHRAPRWLCAATLAAECVLPFHTLMVISSTKDTLFGAAVLTLCVLLFEGIREPTAARRPRWIIGFTACCMLTGLLRNNGFVCVATAAALGGAAWARGRGWGKRTLALSLCGLMLYAGAGEALKAAVNAEDGPLQEMFSVPIQQLSRVYATTDDPEKPLMERYLPSIAHYAPTISDPVKGSFTTEEGSLGEFFALWARVGLRHPAAYLDAWGLMMQGFWQVDGAPAGQYLETKFHTSEEDWLLPNSLLPTLRDLMENLYSRNQYRKIPLYAPLLASGLWCWLMMLGAAAALCLRDGAALCVGLVPLALFATVLLGPCVMVRYIYPLILAAPFLWGVLLLPANPASTLADSPR